MDNPKKHGAPADRDEAAAPNKRFKHAHEGSNGRRKEKKPNKSVAAPVHASPVGRLCSDELGAMFDFLSMVDLHRALSVSRSWSAFIRSSMPCARLRVSCPSVWLVAMSSSALGRHVTGIQHTDDASCKLTSDSLYVLALAMTQLIALQCELNPPAARRMILPFKLKELELDLSAIDADGINPAVEAIGQLAALSELTLVFSSWFPAVSFAPLSKCAALRELTIDVTPVRGDLTQPTDAQIDQLRALHQLRSVNLEKLNSSSLTKLLRAPHSLQWTELGGLSDVDSVGAAALRNLPGLLKLNIWACHDVSFLPALSQLQFLVLQLDEPWAVTADAVVEAISSCRQLTYLELMAPVTSKHLTTLLPRLTRLQSFILTICTELESLSFLSAVPSLQRSLREFILDHCTHPALRSSELRHVVTLKQLVTLRFLKSFADPLDGFTQHLLAPPSSVLPKLTSFEYEAAAPALP